MESGAHPPCPPRSTARPTNETRTGRFPEMESQSTRDTMFNASPVAIGDPSLTRQAPGAFEILQRLAGIRYSWPRICRFLFGPGLDGKSCPACSWDGKLQSEPCTPPCSGRYRVAIEWTARGFMARLKKLQ